MRLIQTELSGVVVVEPVVDRDTRGFFLEVYHAERFRELGLDVPFVQDNHSRSGARTLRGLHLQLREPQGKLVRVISGEILDVAVDVRRGSPTFKRWVAVRLSAANFLQCYIPPGFAHGFYVIGDHAEVEYKCTTPYNRPSEVGIAWNDPDLAIDWPDREPVLSAKDATLPRLAAVLDQLPTADDN